MKTGLKIFLSILPFIVFLNYNSSGQISPGDLSEVHSHLEGMSNCTQCHTLGSKVSNEKCLACHTEIKERLDLNKGYHSSSAVTGKSCVACHNDHHGKTFEIVRFEKEKFDHKQAGYELVGAHAKKECAACHKKEFISSQKIKNKKNTTYLGLGTSCTSCHADYHQNTLSATCTNCHGMDSFKPAVAFDHNKAKFQLVGKHLTVECLKCHKVETKEGKQFQKFTGISYSNCTSCHNDVHKDKFGQNCKECHNEESFHAVAGMADFDHSKTNFKLEDKHQVVACKLCHKTALTDPVKHERCADCHADYHNSQFTKEGVTPDCSSCHSTTGFKGSSYTIEKHATGNFPLEGAHVATPCFACHLKTEKWNFREIGIRCNDCHPDIHSTYIDPKYYPASNCKICHSAETWKSVTFDHSTTGYVLAGAHTKQSCRACHFNTDTEGKTTQKFSELTANCLECHQDKHAGQFEIEGVNDCSRCHTYDNWKASKFDHNTARFVLDGRHKNVACEKCHKPTQQSELSIVQYKLNEFKCETCHH
jgi:hypothetical protein